MQLYIKMDIARYDKRDHPLVRIDASFKQQILDQPDGHSVENVVRSTPKVRIKGYDYM